MKSYKRTPKFTAQFDIKTNNENLPSTIKVIVGANTMKMINSYINTITLNICRRYDYIGILDMYVKFTKGSNIKVKKSIYISEDDLLGGKNVIIWDNPRTKHN